jgi:hypothetical protein
MSNDIEAVLKMEIGRIEGQLDQIAKGQAKVARGFDDAGKKAEGMGARVGAAATAIKTGLVAVIGVAQQVASAIQNIDNQLAKISRTAGSQNLKLTNTLVGLGVRDTGKVARVIRGAQGIANQDEIDTFLGGIGDNLTDKAAAGVGAQFARGGSAIFGGGQTLAGLAGVLGDTPGADLGDLSVIYRRAAGGEFGNAQGKQLNQLMGLGIGRDQALALISTFQRRGQGEGVNAIIAELAGGGDLNKILAGGAKAAGARAAVAGVGDQVGILPDLAAEFGSVGSRDVVGERLAALESNPAAARELQRLRRARQAEISVNMAADEGLGAAESDRSQALDEYDQELLQMGGPVGNANYIRQRAVRAVSDRAAAAGTVEGSTSDPVSWLVRQLTPAGAITDLTQNIGREVGKAVQTKSAGN